MGSSPRILYLDFHADEERHRRKLAGIRRFAKTQGWAVAALPPERSHQADVRALLTRIRPAGCIVECSSRDEPLPPRLFGVTPTVYSDLSEHLKWRDEVATVSCDNGAVARAAFRELSAGLPSCFAVVSNRSHSRWNGERIDAFRALCVVAGQPFHVFGGVAMEDPDRRTARLTRWVAELPRQCAIFATSDRVARQVTEAAQETFRHLPKELTLIGVDGTPEENDLYVPAPDVSSIQLDFELCGWLAAKALLDGLSATYGPLCVLRLKSTQGHGRREPRILKAVEIIRREACNGLTAANLVAHFPGSRRHFDRRFREAMGHSVLDEIISVRLEHARTLLASTEMPIDAIADFCGFGTVQELRKLFRAHHEMSLRQFRANHRR